MSGEPYLHASKIVETANRKKKREVNISTDLKTNWRVKIFCPYIDENQGFLQVGDVIWINFSEKDVTKKKNK